MAVKPARGPRKKAKADVTAKPASRTKADALAMWEDWHSTHAEIPFPGRRENESPEAWAERRLAEIAAKDAAAAERRRARIAEAEELASEYAVHGDADALLRETRQLAAKAANSSFTRLTAEQRRKLEVICGKLRDFLAEHTPGENDAIMRHAMGALMALDSDLAMAAFISAMGEPPAKTREIWVWHVAIDWCRYTGREPKASRNAQDTGTLNNTPLVRFVRAIRHDALPALTDGEILRGIQLAQSQIAERNRKLLSKIRQ